MPNHLRETTLLSLTETVIHEHVNEDQPPAPDTGASGTELESHERSRRLTDPPKPLPGYGPRPLPPVRKEATIDPRKMPPVIPPEHDQRTLVLCFDGTGDQFDNDNSNIVQFVSLLKKDDRPKQMVYYQSGIGTYTSPTVASSLLSTLSKALDQAVAMNLDAHVMDGYEFLMQNYKAGDRISIFGFSRGAYTARSLAGMIHKVGLLPADNWQQVPFAYRMYTRTDEIGWEQSNAFKRAFSVDVTIDFVGVWDTVDSVGLIPKRLPFTVSNTIIRTFRHAVSLDERRAKFKANLWNQPDGKECQLGTTRSLDEDEDEDESPRQSMSSVKKRQSLSPVTPRRPFHWLDDDEKELEDFEGMYSAKLEDKPTDVEEVWFAGCHCDVGGGSVKNSTRHSLARISLRWMIRECFKAGTGIMFDSHRLREVGLDPSTLYPFVTPRPSPLPSHTSRILSSDSPKPTKYNLFKNLFSSNKAVGKAVDDAFQPVEKSRPLTEEEEELRDAMTPVHDQLKRARIWWLIELMPMEFRYQTHDNKWESYVQMNLAQPRAIPRHMRHNIKIHRSVKLRMEASQGKKYVPKAKFSLRHVIWVD